MTRAEQKLHTGAAWHWPGSEDHCVAINRWFAAVNAEERLWSAVSLSAMLRHPWERRSLLQSFEHRMGDRRPTRTGPKRDRYDSALAAIAALRAMLDASEVTP